MAERQPPAKDKLPLLPLRTTAYTAKTSKKKMSMEEKNSRKKELDRARDKTRVNMGSAFQRWRELRDLKGFKTDFELGTFLLDSYECRSKKDPAGHKGTSEPLTPQVPNVKESPDHYSPFREEADDAFKSRMCSVVRCDSWRRGVQCFSLPADSDKRLEWVQFLFLVNGQRIKESSWVDIRVCAEHFTPSCFLQVNPATSIALLNTDAVPSVYKETEPIDPAFKPDQIKTSVGPTPGSSALDKEEISALSAPGSPALSTVSESSESSYCRMLQKIENLDIIREKINLLQRMKMYVVNEKQLLQLFSAKCPLCQSKVKMEKSFHGVLLVLNQQCLQCSYSRQWKNLSEKSISALLDDHQAECLEISVEISADEMSSEKDQIADEEGDHREERDEPSKTDKVENSDDNWEPEHESLILDSDEDEDEDEDYNPSDEDTEESAPKQRELCTECGKLFKTRRPHICEYKIKPFSCNICGKRCVSEQSLAIHSKIHNTNHQFLCKFCLAGFKTKTDKNNHEQIHPGEERPYKCPHCSEMFDTFKNRQVHMKDHPKQGLLKCHICGMEFLYFKVFQRHLLVHTGEKPFKCSVCERGFNQSGHLKSHMRMHTGERPYKCQHCNRGFNHNVSLKSHLKRFHTESENQKKTANLEGSVGGDPEGERGTDSLNDIVEEDHAVKDVWTGGGGFKKRRTTGRPIGRPKKKIKDTTVEEEKRQRQDKNTNTAKDRNRKPRKRRQSSSEDDEEELCESDESLDLTEDEEKNNEKVTSRQKENEDLDFDPTEIKNRERKKVCKTPKRPRGRPRKKAVC
ncbi:uncharacterized protein LOC119786170 [Cyprinodon tularosa]|uniref:uncharacterized protein LOC119786170 n=1 Tax=Cyprinodon tularosa TaxID=77115 RepID=UPI0018E24C27|nr:uncharacterized protein LOC119786170 [Cyprinodon tularosa]